MRNYLIVIVVAAAVTFALSWVVYRVAMRHRWYPAVRARDVHRTPKPRLGGTAMFVGFLVALAVASQISWFGIVFEQPGRIWGLIAAATLMHVVGVVDDFVDLDWMLKLAAQIIAGIILAVSGTAIASLPIGGVTVASSWMSMSMTVLAIVLVMNAVNFIDGLDGLVAGVSMIASGVFLAYTYFLSEFSGQTGRFTLGALVSAILVGMCLGFLPINWNPSKIIMGDGGSLLVGLLMATSAISVTGDVDPMTISRNQLFPAFIPLVIPFAVLIIPIVDFTSAVVRRIGSGRSPFSADRKHLHHRLLDMGHTQRRAVLILYSWTAVVSVGALLGFLVQPGWIAVTFTLVGPIICAAWTVAPLNRRRRERRHATMEAALSGREPESTSASTSKPTDKGLPDPSESPPVASSATASHPERSKA